MKVESLRLHKVTLEIKEIINSKQKVFNLPFFSKHPKFPAMLIEYKQKILEIYPLFVHHENKGLYMTTHKHSKHLIMNKENVILSHDYHNSLSNHMITVESSL